MLVKHSGRQRRTVKMQLLFQETCWVFQSEKTEQSTIDEEVVSREQVQKLNAVADFELRKTEGRYEQVDPSTDYTDLCTDLRNLWIIICS